jgi:hypothetical protein
MITYDYGDGMSETFSPTDGVVGHHYSESGLYVTTATLTFMVADGGQTHEARSTCTATLAVG